MNENINALIEREQRLQQLKSVYEQYEDYLAQFKFAKMKYMRAYDNFTTAIATYESMDENADTEDLNNAEQQYLKWKNMAGKNYDECMELKEKGEDALAQLKQLRSELMPTTNAEGFVLSVDMEIQNVQNQIKELSCEK